MGFVCFRKKGPIAYVTLNRPAAMNAFNYDLLDELESIVDKLRCDSTVHLVLFTGAGERAFSVGADLKERKTLTDVQVMRNLNKIGDVFTAIERLPQPTIAMMNGYAFGGGMELALACDFRIAADTTVMGLTETGLGIIPGAGGTQRLPRLIGEAKALELILTAKRLTAEEAMTCGLVTRVAEADALIDTTADFAERILANAPIALQQAKFAVRNGMNVDLQTGLTIERKAYEITIPTEDRVEALDAFTDKRKPNFKGK